MTLMMEFRKRGEVIPPLKGVRPPKHYTRDAAPQFQTEGLTGILDDLLGGGLEASVNLDINVKRDEDEISMRDIHKPSLPPDLLLGDADLDALARGEASIIKAPASSNKLTPRDAAPQALTGLSGGLGGPFKELTTRDAAPQTEALTGVTGLLGGLTGPVKGLLPRDAARELHTGGLTGLLDDLLGGGLEASVNQDLNVKRDADPQTAALGPVTGLLGGLTAPVTGLLPRDVASPRSSFDWKWADDQKHRRDAPPQTEAITGLLGGLADLAASIKGLLPREASPSPQTEALGTAAGLLGGLIAPVTGLLPRSASDTSEACDCDYSKRDAAAPRREWQQGQLVNYDTDRRHSATAQDLDQRDLVNLDRRSAAPEPESEAKLAKFWQRFLSARSANAEASANALPSIPRSIKRRRDFPSSLPKGEIRCETSAGSPETIDLIIISERIAKYPDSQWCCSGPGICQELEAAGTAKVGVCNRKGENHCFHCGPFANAVYLIQEKCRMNFADGGGKGKMGKQSNRAGGFVK
jgi:hypothetical protein